MDGVSKWAIVIIICSVICMLIEMIIPDGRLEKAVRFVLSAFLICAVIIPFGEMAFGIKTELGSIDINQYDSGEIEKIADEQSVALAKVKITNMVAGILKDNEILYKEIEINMDSDEEGSISIIEATVTVSVDYAEKIPIIKSKIENELGINCSIVASEV